MNVQGGLGEVFRCRGSGKESVRHQSLGACLGLHRLKRNNHSYLSNSSQGLFK